MLFLLLRVFFVVEVFNASTTTATFLLLLLERNEILFSSPFWQPFEAVIDTFRTAPYQGGGAHMLQVKRKRVNVEAGRRIF